MKDQDDGNVPVPGTELHSAMRHDEHLEIASRRSDKLVRKYGPVDAACIAMHEALETTSRVMYRGSKADYLSQLGGMIDSESNTFTGYLDFERARLIEKIEGRRHDRCSNCKGDCQYCSDADYSVFDRSGKDDN